MGKEIFKNIRKKLGIYLLVLLAVSFTAPMTTAYNWDNIGLKDRIDSTQPFTCIMNHKDDTISVIDTANNNIIATVDAGSGPAGVAVSPDGAKVYVAHYYNNNVCVIDTSKNVVTATIPVGENPTGIAISLDGSEVYVANSASNTVSLIDTATNTITSTIPTEGVPVRVGVTSDEGKVYVTLLYPRYLQKVFL